MLSTHFFPCVQCSPIWKPIFDYKLTKKLKTYVYTNEVYNCWNIWGTVPHKFGKSKLLAGCSIRSKDFFTMLKYKIRKRSKVVSRR